MPAHLNFFFFSEKFKVGQPSPTLQGIRCTLEKATRGRSPLKAPVEPRDELKGR